MRAGNVLLWIQTDGIGRIFIQPTKMAAIPEETWPQKLLE